MAWVTLVIAGLFEIVWAIGLKYTEGFTRPIPTTITVVAMVISVVMLGMALKELPLGTAYAIWTGIGTVGTAIIGMMIFGESTAVIRLACIAMVVSGIVGLKVFS